MRMRRGTRLGVALLAGTAGLLSLINLHLLRSPIDTSPVAPAADKADAPRRDGGELATALDERTAEVFRQIVDRPLFNPSRRPVQRTETAAAQPEAASELRLVGVMKEANQPPRALIRSAGEATGKWIAEGAEFKGWTLRKVKDHSVIVEAGGRSQELTLSKARRARKEPAGRIPEAEP